MNGLEKCNESEDSKGSWIGPLLGLISLVGLLIWQGWLTLGLFGNDQSFQILLDDRPILSGSHPLHLYHGFLGAKALLEHGSTCCFDPSFEAGYPKTPIFDGGCRPAELFLLAGGAQYRPQAYKIGVAAYSLLAPCLVVIAGLALGLRLFTASLAGWLGMGIWWSGPCQDAFHGGDLDILTVGLGLMCQFAFLIKLHQRPSLTAWMGVLLSTALSWFAHPLITGLTLPLILVYYMSVGPRHVLFWHGALFTALTGGILANGFWLMDWATHWWLRNPLPTSTFVLPHRTFSTLWNAPIWGSCGNRAFAVALMSLALVGNIVFNCRRERATARLMGLGSLGLLLLALAGIANEFIAKLSGSLVFVPSLFLMVLPAAFAIHEVGRAVGGWARERSVKAVFFLLLVAAPLAYYQQWPGWISGFAQLKSLEIGFSEDRLAMLASLQEETAQDARILWEAETERVEGSHWTALLPILTERSYIGGLDPDMGIEHSALGLTAHGLAGRPLPEWSDHELLDYCRRYNVGWICCSSASIQNRLKKWPDAALDTQFTDPSGAYYLFAIKRESKSYILKGRAELLRADSDRIALGNVVPDKGVVVLSIHYQSGLRVFPNRIKIERELDPLDPIPLIRLRVPGPTTCVTLTWDRP
jgi:hypothetical protein